jgi:hypothetical protein
MSRVDADDKDDKDDNFVILTKLGKILLLGPARFLKMLFRLLQQFSN